MLQLCWYRASQMHESSIFMLCVVYVVNLISRFRISSLLPQVKEIEKKDAVLTNSQQIDRLLRPGSKYSNLNPYDVRSS